MKLFPETNGEEHQFTQLKSKPRLREDEIRTRLSENQDEGEDDERSTRRSLLILALIFLAAVLSLGLVYLSFPQLNE